jgi:hypothetical protein
MRNIFSIYEKPPSGIQSIMNKKEKKQKKLKKKIKLKAQ